MGIKFLNTTLTYKINNEQRSSIQHYGIMHVSNLLIWENMFVNGLLDMEQSNINNLKVIGKTKITNSTITGNYLIITGSLMIKDSQINCISSFCSSNIKISNSSIMQKIIIEKKSRLVVFKELLILDHSTVNGDIIFESGKGIIISYVSTINGVIRGGQFIDYDTSHY